MRWDNIPIKDGWYWHRFYVSRVPIYNICYLRNSDGRISVHYLGEVRDEPFEPQEGARYWGPLAIPPD